MKFMQKMAAAAMPLLLCAPRALAEAAAPAAGVDAGRLLAAGLVLLLLFALLRSRRGGAMGFAKYARVEAKTDIPDTTFSDVAANAEALSCLRDLVDFIKTPERFARYGARIPRGVLLYGPPGTGKTLLARALAGEAKAPFFAVSGADFVQVYVGVGASRIRSLFKRARKAGRAVIFIDEIDAIGKKRDNGNDEREQTLNALLTEMSGFSQEEGIVVLAATNRLDTLDEALLRAGRFDRQIEVGLPGREERLQILRVHARGKPLSERVDFSDLAAQTAFFTGARLETLLNEAAIRAARRDAPAIEPEDVRMAFQSALVGEDRAGAKQSERERRVVAAHEAGHAVATRALTPEARIRRVSIIPSTRGAAGYSLAVMPERMLHTRGELLALMAVALAGRAAEELAFGAACVTTGAADDLRKARDMARRMAGEFGMAGVQRDEAGERAAAAAFMNEAYELAKSALREHAQAVEALSAALLAEEAVEGERLDALLAK